MITHHLNVITSSFNWLSWFSLFFVMDLSDYFDFGFTTLQLKTALKARTWTCVLNYIIKQLSVEFWKYSGNYFGFGLNCSSTFAEYSNW